MLVSRTLPAYFIFLRAPEQMSERLFHVSGESRGEDVLLSPKLVPGLPHDAVDDVQSGDLVNRLALQDELLNVLHNMLVELDGLHCGLRDCSHLSFRNRNLLIVKREELKFEMECISPA